MKNSQEVAKRIKYIAKLKKITIGQMLLECDLNKNALSTMQSGGYLPRTESITKIADYLDCSVDYLLGRTDNPNSHKTTEIEQKESYGIKNQVNVNGNKNKFNIK